MFKQYYFFLLLFLSIFLRAANIGSDTAVARFSTLQTIFNGDEIASFAGIEGGLELFGINTTALFRSVLPVEGDIAFRKGTFQLGSDFIMSENSAIVSLGNITGDGYRFNLSCSTTLIPALSDILIDCETTFLVDALQLSDVETCDWSFDSQFIAVGLDNQGSSHDVLLIYRFDGSTLTLTDSSLLGQFQEVTSVRWHPSKYLLAVTRKTVSGSLEELLIFSVDSGTGLLTQVSGDEVDAYNAGCAWHPTGNFLAVTRRINSAEVAVYSVDGLGNLSAGPVATADYAPNRNARDKSIAWDATGSYLAIGLINSGSNPTLIVYEFEDSIPLLTENASINPGQRVESIDWHPTCTDLIAIARRGSGDRLEVYQHDPNTVAIGNRLIKVTGTTLSANGRAIAWSPDGSCIASGQNQQGTNEFRVYFFDKDSLSFSLVNGFNSAGQVVSTRWAPNGRFIAQGNTANTLSIYETNAGEGAGKEFTFSDLSLSLGANTVFKMGKIHFVGNSIINGRGNSLTLASTCTFIVDSNSTLLLKDIVIEGVNTNKLQCADNSSTFSLENVSWFLDGDFSFTVGRFDVIKNFCISSDLNYTFSYQTDQISLIGAHSQLCIDEHVNFFYDPISQKNDLLCFSDKSSQLLIKGGALFVSPAGLQLTKGTLLIDGQALFESAATNQSEGIILGDGVSSANNISIKWLGESGYTMGSGFLVYKNV